MFKCPHSALGALLSGIVDTFLIICEDSDGFTKPSLILVFAILFLKLGLAYIAIIFDIKLRITLN